MLLGHTKDIGVHKSTLEVQGCTDMYRRKQGAYGIIEVA